ncbi:MAG: dipeptidase [Defluviitoga tunisiensis]
MNYFSDITNEILNESIVIDGHFDLLMDLSRQRKLGFCKVMESDHLENFKKGGLTCVVSSIFIENCLIPELSLRESLDQISSFYQEISESKDNFIFCKTYDDVYKAKKEDKIGVFLSFEGVEPLYNDLYLLEIFYELGVRFVGLTWSRRNYAGDGSRFSEPDTNRYLNGLSDFGVELVKKSQKMNMIIDVSHLNDKGFWDVIKLTTKPIIASHSNCRNIVNIERNLTDEQIKAIASTGGVIGINALNKFASPTPENANVYDLVNNIDYIVNLVGIDHVGLGFDFCGHLKKFDPPIVTDNRISKSFEILENQSNIPVLVEALLERGYEKKDIKKILGENFLRVYKIVFNK